MGGGALGLSLYPVALLGDTPKMMPCSACTSAAVLVLEDMIECGESIPAEVESGDGMEVAIHAMTVPSGLVSRLRNVSIRQWIVALERAGFFI